MHQTSSRTSNGSFWGRNNTMSDIGKLIESAVGSLLLVIVIGTLAVGFLPTIVNISGNLFYSGIAFASLFNPTFGILIILYSLGVFAAMIGAILLMFKLFKGKSY